MKRRFFLKALFTIVFLGSMTVGLFIWIGQKNKILPLKVGYFLGGRTTLLLRAYENHEFDKRNLSVRFYSKGLYDENYSVVPKSIARFCLKEYVGKATGTELVDGMLEGKYDLATIGESSFISSIYAGKPIVAIAELGHDVKGQSGHVFLMRKGLKVNKPEDYLGKVLVSRRAGPGDSVFLKDYLNKEGINLEKDILQLDSLPQTLEEKEKLPKDKIILIDAVFEDKMRKGLKNGIIDGGYFHLMSFEEITDSFELIQPLEYWANPELSCALLVCTKEFLHNNYARLVAFLEVYIKRIKYEHSLSYEERTKWHKVRKRQIAINLYGLNYPQYDIIPTVDPQLIYDMISLLKKYKYLERKENVKVEDFVDNSLVLKAAENLGITEKDDYWGSKF